MRKITVMAIRPVALLIWIGTSAPIISTSPIEPLIETGDVSRFYQIYDRADGHPTGASLQHDYLDRGSFGLQHLGKIRNVTGDTIAQALAANPNIFADAKRCLAVLPRVRSRTITALRTLRRLYPAAEFPPVTIVVSRGKPVGVADSTGVMIGLEALCAVNYLGANVEDRFVHTITHEYIHVQQALKAPALYNNPKPTVLQSSIIEGAADFTAAVISGETYHSPYAPADGTQVETIERRFVADEDKTDLSDWIDNGTLTTPGDLGYWVGYQIVKSYYDRAGDKRKALREIIEMSNPQAFLARSGWFPGTRVQ